MICAGHHTERATTFQVSFLALVLNLNFAEINFQRDSGGPLQIHHIRLQCMYDVVGITSFSITTC